MNKQIDVFISHSNEDRKLANTLCSYLEERHISCWIAPRDTNKRIGNDYAESIIEGIRMSKLMVVVFNKHANESMFVKNEVERAFHYKLILMPFKTDKTIPSGKLELFLSSIHWLDASGGRAEDYFSDLYKNCAALLNKPTHITQLEKNNIEEKKNSENIAKKRKLLTYPVVLRSIFLVVAVFFLTYLAIKYSKSLQQPRAAITGKDFFDQVVGDVKSIEEESHRALYELKVWRKDPRDTIWSPKLTTYDRIGNPVKEQEYSILEKNYYDAVVYEYKEGKITRFLEYGMNNELNHVNTILKAEPAFKILQFVTESKSDHLDNDTSNLVWTGNRITKISSSKKDEVVMIEYNKQGHTTIITTYDSNNRVKETTMFEYMEFDKKGNWTKRVMYNKEKPTDYPFIEERKITYY